MPRTRLFGGATRSRSTERLSTLLIAAGAFTVYLSAPTTLVGAEAPTPSVNGDAALREEPATPRPPQPSGSPSPPAVGEDAQQIDDSGSGEAVAPARPAASTAVLAARSASVAILDGTLGSDFRFSPRSIRVGTGDTVKWTNKGNEPHDVKGDGLNSSILQPGQGYSHTFASPGTFNYICSIHPQMKGTVIVHGSGSQGGGGSGGNGRGGGSSGKGGGSGTSGGAAPSTTGPTSESAAGSSPDASGTSGQLPVTGMPVLPLLIAGLGLCLAGVLLRMRARAG